ncbi:hypothetical protein ACYZTM_08505 [Pseudomonas sp. MDT2-39-1]
MSNFTWLQEFRVYVNDVEVDWFDVRLNLVAGEICTLKLDYKYSWLIGQSEGFLALEYSPNAEGQGLVFDPPLGQLCEMAKDTTSLSWSISTEYAHSGTFELHFALPKFEQLAKSPPLPGVVVDFAQELEVKFDEFPTAFGASAFPCHGATHTVTVQLKPSSSLLNTPVKLLWAGEPATALGVVVTPSVEDVQLLGPDGASWTLNCLDTIENGDFSLQLMFVEWGRELLPLTMSLGHNLVTAKRWSESTESLPGYPRKLEKIRAISSFLKIPVSGVLVNLQEGSHRFYDRYSDVIGEVSSSNVDEDVYISMRIVNTYDSSVVGY